LQPQRASALSPEDLVRHSRAILVKSFGTRGLAKLRSTKALVVGCGALGTLASELLVRMGLGKLVVADGDRVELSNLSRAHLFTEADARAGAPKAKACAERLREIDSSAEVEHVESELGFEEILEIAREVDVVVDATDRLESRAAINDACAALGKPWLFMGVGGWWGNAMMVNPRAGPCLRCVLPSLEATCRPCEVIGVVAVAVSLTVSVGVSLLLKHLLELEPDYEHLYFVDASAPKVLRFKVRKNPSCPSCSSWEAEGLKKERKKP